MGNWVRTPDEMLEKLLTNIEVDENECWIWQKSIEPSGYGQVSCKGLFPHRGQTLRTHRLAYMLIVGEPSPGESLHHVCENKVCCNPGHLLLVSSHAEHKRLHTPDLCPKGHDPNWHVKPNGSRACRDCDRERNALNRRDPDKAERLRRLDKLSRRRRRSGYQS